MTAGHAANRSPRPSAQGVPCPAASNAALPLPAILAQSRTRVVFGAGMLRQLGAIAKEEGACRVLLVTDGGLVRAGHVEQAVQSLREAGLTVTVFDGVEENPTTKHVEAAVDTARSHSIDFLVGLGGGSSMDCAKGANFLLTNGGRMEDYWGVNKATRPMLPMVAIPTTAGTGSEAQSFALICDPVTNRKMACGDRKAACRVAVLDPDLTRTQPPAVAAATGIDAVAHAVETAVTTKRNAVSLVFTREAWQRLDASFDAAMCDAQNLATRSDMLLGAHLAGCAIEHSMLGAAHACANPLTARCGITHGVAVGVMLPHVIRYNVSEAEGVTEANDARGGTGNLYAALGVDGEALALRVEAMLEVAGLPRRLNECGVGENLLRELADDAARQWTARFNPRPVHETDLLTLYVAAFA